MDKYGINEIDSPHDELFALVDKTKAAISNGDSHFSVIFLLSELEKYTQEHFADEEKFMLDNNYKWYNEHKKKHDVFRVLVSSVIDSVSKTGKPSLDVIDMVETWLKSHTSIEVGLFADFSK